MENVSGPLRAPAMAVAAMVAAMTVMAVPAVMVLTAGPAAAGTVAVTDGSHVLSRADLSAVSAAASRLGPDPVRIYTTTALATDNAAFDDYYARQLDGAGPATVLVGVNTRSRHLTIHSGKRSGFHAKDARAATAAFEGGLRTGRGYAGALVALFRSLRTSARGAAKPPGSGTTAPAPAQAPSAGLRAGAERASDSGMNIVVIAAIAAGGVVVVIGLALAAARRRPRRRRAAAVIGDRWYGD